MTPATMKNDRRDGETGAHVVDDGGEVRRQHVCPPVPDGSRHQHAEQDGARRPERRDVMRRELVRKADLGAQMADDSNEQDVERQADRRHFVAGASFDCLERHTLAY